MELYYAIFSLNEKNIEVVFPDLNGAATFGSDMHEALYMAKDLLAGWLIDEEESGNSFPKSSDPKKMKTEEGELIIPIEVDLDFYRKKFNSAPVKKTLLIPNYLNELGKQAGIHFSHTLTEALEQKLGV